MQSPLDREPRDIRTRLADARGLVAHCQMLSGDLRDPENREDPLLRSTLEDWMRQLERLSNALITLLEGMVAEGIDTLSDREQEFVCVLLQNTRKWLTQQAASSADDIARRWAIFRMGDVREVQFEQLDRLDDEQRIMRDLLRLQISQVLKLPHMRNTLCDAMVEHFEQLLENLTEPRQAPEDDKRTSLPKAS